MDPNGEAAVRVFGAPSGQSLSQVAWSPDGRWLTYIRRAGQVGEAVLEARLPGAGSSIKIYENADLQGFCWISSGHLVLNLWEAPEQPSSNLWEIAVDPKQMKPVDKPRRLTNWAGFSVAHVSASKDGRRLAITKRSDQSDVFVGELADHGEKLLHLRRFTTDERIDWPGDWSPDSKSLLIQSDRTGHMSIFRQPFDAANPDPVVVNQDDNWVPTLSPDGRWLLYLVSQPTAARLMRMPVTGGPAEFILETEGPPPFVRSSKAPKIAGGTHVTARGNPSFRCPTQPGPLCVLSEALEGELVFSSFDPVPSAKKVEVFRIAVNDPDDVFWDLSRDGSRIAYGNRSVYSLIRVRELSNGTARDISVRRWPELVSISWSADGKGLFAADYAPRGSSLLHITLDGKVRVLYKGVEPIELLKASRDGRYLAFGEVVSSANIWLIEGIPP
jgi:dipeptidyl aminopeptidase/acylaminoacyl peptidase